MIKNKLPVIATLSLVLPCLFACGNTKANADWLYTKEEMSEFSEMFGKINQKDDGSLEFKASTGFKLFKEEITDKNLRVFNLTKALQQMESNGDKFITYENINDNKIKPLSIINGDELNEITVNFNGNNEYEYGMLINKKASENDNFIIITKEESDESLTSPDPQLEFEENYIAQDLKWENGGKFVISMLANIGSICAGVEFASPTTVVSGIFGVLQNIGDLFSAAKAPTIGDVLKKLDIMDAKLDQISEKIDENHNQLMNETIRTQALVDQVLLNQMEASIDSFQVDFATPINNFKRDFSDYMQQTYKSYVKSSQLVSMYLSKDKDNNWKVNHLTEEEPGVQTNLTIEIEDFEKSKNNLQENGNIVTKGFMDEFLTDIENSVENSELPEGLSKLDARNFAAANIAEHFIKDYYVTNHQKALDLKNMVINYAKKINGTNGTSVVGSYINRLKYMYNFAKECKNINVGIMANLLHELDMNTILAAQACSYAEINNEELITEFSNARKIIRNTIKDFKEIPDNYSFILGNTVTSGFYQAKWETSYTNPGNSCSLHASFLLNKVSGGYSPKYEKDDIKKHSFIDSTDHTRIVTRWNLLRELGATEETSYIEYLVSK